MSEVDEQRGDPEIGKCHVCGKEFSSQRDLSEHLMAAHDDKDLLQEPRAEA